ncbi:MAG: proton-conducting transporter membrane subunit [Prolixibacteraceae bacterium]
MEKHIVEILNLLAILSLAIFPFLKARKLAFTALVSIIVQVLLSFVLVYQVFTNGSVEYSYSGSLITGSISVKIDYLSAWFILVIVFTYFTGAWYGIHYMKKYREQTSNLILHAIAYIFVFIGLIDICIVQNSIVFLVVWEIMAFSSFIVIVFEHYNKETLKAGLNFLIQSHISILFLTIAFIWAKVKTGSFDFSAISVYTALHPRMGLGLFALFFIGFAIKAGFVPFHTWLPHAHPVAPAHISGVMSGVIIKIGIFGILRMLTIINANYTIIGVCILIISIVTGLYGVMMAIVQNNLKRLLAYSSIENIGIIGLGIGLGCLGKASNHQWLVIAGFGGALLHTLNHSLFKSLLFYIAGNVYQATHTLNIDSLGGLLKKIPRTAYLFLIGSLAICGFPPFNGFVSEFYIYNGFFKGLQSNQSMFNLAMLFSIFALVLIGGLALITFTKAFGIVFLGKSREPLHVDETFDNQAVVFPFYLIALAMLLVGLFPILFSSSLLKTSSLFFNTSDSYSFVYLDKMVGDISSIGFYSIGFILLAATFFVLRKMITSKRPSQTYETWGCGYVAPIQKAQYSGRSYTRTYSRLFAPIVYEGKDFKRIKKTSLYPNHRKFSTYYADFWEQYLVLPPTRWVSFILDKFQFIQNGNVQSYVIYGLAFILVIVIVSMLSSINLGV